MAPGGPAAGELLDRLRRGEASWDAPGSRAGVCLLEEVLLSMASNPMPSVEDWKTLERWSLAPSVGLHAWLPDRSPAQQSMAWLVLHLSGQPSTLINPRFPAYLKRAFPSSLGPVERGQRWQAVIATADRWASLLEGAPRATFLRGRLVAMETWWRAAGQAAGSASGSPVPFEQAWRHAHADAGVEAGFFAATLARALDWLEDLDASGARFDDAFFVGRLKAHGRMHALADVPVLRDTLSHLSSKAPFPLAFWATLALWEAASMPWLRKHLDALGPRLEACRAHQAERFSGLLNAVGAFGDAPPSVDLQAVAFGMADSHLARSFPSAWSRHQACVRECALEGALPSTEAPSRPRF